MMYPNNIKKTIINKSVSHRNRGMNLENIINLTNNYYLEHDIAVIHKKPTPIGIVDVSFTNQKKIINKAYFKEPSTLDYNGVYKGKYIDFDAKETLSKTAFPLANIHEHQKNHIKQIIKHGGITFLIIKMNHNYHLLLGEDYISFIKENKRKSIPYNYIEKKGFLIKENLNPPLDYLKIIDKIFFKGEKEEYEN